MSDLDEKGLPPVMVSLGGFPYNGEHIDHWRERALKAEAAIRAYKAAEGVGARRDEVVVSRKDAEDARDLLMLHSSNPAWVGLSDRFAAALRPREEFEDGRFEVLKP